MHFKVIISDETIKQFDIKCGQKLTKIAFYGIISKNKCKLLLRLCPNLISFSGLNTIQFSEFVFSLIFDDIQRKNH
jgi:hypothetical protein